VSSGSHFNQVCPVGILELMQQEYNLCKSMWSQISDLSFEEALGDGWVKAVHEDDKKALMDGWNQVNSQEHHFQKYRFVP
jgi:hypothetical protein